MRVFVTGGSGFIGTALINRLLGEGAEVMNYDCAPPHDASHRVVWRRGDILDACDLSTALHGFDATHVVHLAARADLDESGSVTDYRENTDGVSNLLTAVSNTAGVQRLVVASTQMVCQPGYWPKHDEDFSPHTVYGHSKVETERLTRAAELPCPWTIVRPTNIWGPLHARHGVHFFGLLKRGMYLHPSGRSARRCWGYVENVAYQIARILELPAEQVDGQVLYVGDAPFNLIDWVNAVSLRLTGRKVRRAPRSLLYAIALAGELVERCGKKAPLTLLRYKAMTEDYLTPIERTLDLVGPGPVSMEQGVEETLRWYASLSESPPAGQSVDPAASNVVERLATAGSEQ